MVRFVLPVLASFAAAAQTRLSNDSAKSGGYVSAYTLATGQSYTDGVLSECLIARGRQNEPSVAVDPRDLRVLIGSSNDYCGVYAGSTPGNFAPNGPIWLGYYRSEDGGASFVSSLVPGYPGDASPFAPLAQIRTASSGDPVIAWDNHGRVFMGSESSGDPAGTAKTFGDVWVATYDNPTGESGRTLDDGKRYRRTVTVATGSSAPNLLGKFHDKTAIEVDRTGGTCDGYVYFAWTRYSGNGNVSTYFVRSADHGQTFSNPIKVNQNFSNSDEQDPEVSVTGNGHVYVNFSQQVGFQVNVTYSRSTDCGATFEQPRVAATFSRYEAIDVAAPVPVPTKAVDDPLFGGDESPGSLNRDCGDFDSACQSGYTFFRRVSSPRATADQSDKAHEYVYVVIDANKPGTLVPTGTTYGTVGSGTGSQTATWFFRVDGSTGARTVPLLVDDQPAGHQWFPDVSVDQGVVHVVWYDSRNDPAYSPTRPIGNDASGRSTPALDVYAAVSADRGATFTGRTRLTSKTQVANWEQFANRSVPFNGDYLWVTSIGNFAYAAWTDYRNVVAGSDPREPANDRADVRQCRTLTSGGWTGDQCPHDGGIDQNIYGDLAP